MGKRARVWVLRDDLLAAFSTISTEEGPGSRTAKHHSVARDADTVAPVVQDQQALVQHLQEELSRREHDIEGLRTEVRDLKDELRTVRGENRQLNAEMRALLREDWGSKRNGTNGSNGHSSPRGISGFLVSLLGGR